MHAPIVLAWAVVMQLNPRARGKAVQQAANQNFRTPKLPGALAAGVAESTSSISQQHGRSHELKPGAVGSRPQTVSLALAVRQRGILPALDAAAVFWKASPAAAHCSRRQRTLD